MQSILFDRIVDSNCLPLLGGGGRGVRFLIGEQSPENSHFVPARRVSGRLGQLSFRPPNNCPPARLSSEPMARMNHCYSEKDDWLALHFPSGLREAVTLSACFSPFPLLLVSFLRIWFPPSHGPFPFLHFPKYPSVSRTKASHRSERRPGEIDEVQRAAPSRQYYHRGSLKPSVNK